MLEQLAGSAWRLELEDGTVQSKVLLLLGDGMIGGHISPGERRWVVRDGQLKFLDANGVATILFDEPTTSAGAVDRLVGRARFQPTLVHVLSRIELPNGSHLGQPALDAPAEFITAIPAPRRQNLVVLRANRHSLHRTWPQDIDDSDRNWDFCISWYDKEPPVDVGPCEYLTHQPAERKFASIHGLFRPGSPLWAYTHIWMPDDDLLTSWKDINRIFEVCYRHKLALAQPSLRLGSYAGISITMQDPEKALRFTEYVEGMCPVFSTDALRACVGTFKGSVSGWGLDFIWSRLLGHVTTRVGIIDEVAVTHARPVATNYDGAAAARESQALMELYGTAMPKGMVGSLFKAAVQLL